VLSKKIIYVLILPIIFLGSLFSGNALSQDNRILEFPKTFQIDGTEIAREDFAKTFIEAVSVPITYNPHNLVPTADIDYDAYPWFYSHAYPEKGLPTSLAVNKWVKDIRISFGVPYDMKPFNASIIDGKRATDYETWPVVNKRYIVQKYFAKHNSGIKKQDDFQALEGEVKETAKVLDELLPVSVSYQDFETETPEEYGNLRILFFDDKAKYYGFDSLLLKRVSKDKYKVSFDFLRGTLIFVSFKSPYIPKHFLINGFDNQFRSLGIFTEHSQRKVTGYILPNEKNEIEMAFCYIWEGHSTDQKIELVRECLVRALGIPNEINSRSSSKHFSILVRTPHSKAYSDWLNNSFSLSEHDQLIVKTLYHPQLSSGTNYIDLRKLFSEK